MLEPCASSSLLKSLGRLLQGRQLSAEGLDRAKGDLACRNERSRHSGRCHGGSQTTIPRVSKRLGSGLLCGGETRIRRREWAHGTSLHIRPSTRFCPPNQAARDIVSYESTSNQRYHLDAQEHKKENRLDDRELDF